jgi:hypothetical protein
VLLSYALGKVGFGRQPLHTVTCGQHNAISAWCSLQDTVQPAAVPSKTEVAMCGFGAPGWFDSPTCMHVQVQHMCALQLQRVMCFTAHIVRWSGSEEHNTW